MILAYAMIFISSIFVCAKKGEWGKILALEILHKSTLTDLLLTIKVSRYCYTAHNQPDLIRYTNNPCSEDDYNSA